MARELLGVELMVGLRSATILRAQGFLRDENTGVYAPVQGMEPGGVFIPRYRNSLLLLLATQDGGCVLIQAVEVAQALFDGAGRVTEALLLETPRAKGTTVWVEDHTLAIKLEGAPEEVPVAGQHRTTEANGIGEEALRRLMPRIVDIYLKQPGQGFAEFLNGLLARCANERELRQLIQGMRKK